MSDYKNRELNLFSADARNKLRVISENNAVLESEVFKFKHGLASPDSKGDVTGNMPVYIPRLCADVGGAAVYISDWLWQDRQTIAAEQSRAIAAETVLRSDSKINFDTNALAISQEVVRASAADSKHAGDIAIETLTREQADSQLTTALTLETSARQAGDSALSGLIGTNKQLFDVHALTAQQAYMSFDSRITAEVSRATAAESLEAQYRAAVLISAQGLNEENYERILAETARAGAAEAGLQSQISSLLANTDAVALNSLAELVTDYRVNGSGLEARLVFLEGVIASLVAKIM